VTGRARKRHRAAGGRRSGAVGGLAAVGLTGVVLMLSHWNPAGAGGTDSSGAPSRPDSSRSESVDAPQAVPARRAGSLRPEPPTRSVLPNGTVIPVRAVDSRPDGTLDVPSDIRVAGWWRGGSRLGDPFGSTLVAAHVDSRAQGLGPFASLLSVRPGQTVVLTSAHLRQSFEVTSLRLVPQGSLAHQRWIYTPRGRRRLTLVTCAGPYVAQRGGYQNLAVITATPTSAPVRKGVR
jgi:hypothetical protein